MPSSIEIIYQELSIGEEFWLHDYESPSFFPLRKIPSSLDNLCQFSFDASKRGDTERTVPELVP